jgi:uncharacterized protein with NRDE domain
MCLIVLLHKTIPGFPVVLAANRDERYARQGEPPKFWDKPHQFFAGRDPLAGGTWLGVNLRGVLVALSNRKTDAREIPDARSRGQLVLDVLAAPNAADALRMAQASVRQHSYNPFNLLCADSQHAVVLHYDSTRERVVELPAGTHVLTTAEVNDWKLPRVARAHSLAANRKPTDLEQAKALLQRICRDHGGVEPNAETLCMHGEQAGTVSSSIITLDTRGNLESFYHAQGHPCRTEYKCVFAAA